MAVYVTPVLHPPPVQLSISNLTRKSMKKLRLAPAMSITDCCMHR